MTASGCLARIAAIACLVAACGGAKGRARAEARAADEAPAYDEPGPRDFQPAVPVVCPPLPAGVTERYVDEPIFQGRVRLVEAGQGQAAAIVLVHGIGTGAGCDWYGVLPVLARHAHVLAFDLPGFGRSERRNVAYSPVLYAAFVQWLVQAEVRRPYVLVGHSLGGAIALRHSAAWPEHLQRLVIVDAAGILQRAALAKSLAEGRDPVTGLTNRARALAGRVIQDMAHLPMDLELVWGARTARKILLGGTTAKVAALSLIDEDFSLLLGRVRVPTAILWGEQDNVAPLRTGRLLAAMLPDARLEVLPGASHAPMEDQPERFAERLLAAVTQPLPPAVGLPAATTETRVGRCKGESGKVFTGNWARIEIRDCSDVRLVGVSVGALVVDDSDVVIEHSRVQGGPVGIRLHDADLMATGLVVRADVGIELDDSRIDLAGADIVASQAAIQTRSRSEGLFSACRVHSPHLQGGLHGLRKLTEDDQL